VGDANDAEVIERALARTSSRDASGQVLNALNDDAEWKPAAATRCRRRIAAAARRCPTRASRRREMQEVTRDTDATAVADDRAAASRLFVFAEQRTFDDMAPPLSRKKTVSRMSCSDGRLPAL
jgi:hypothetical protein